MTGEGERNRLANDKGERKRKLQKNNFGKWYESQ